MAKDYYKGVTIVYDGDTTKISAALSKLNGEMRQSQGAARALNTALKLDSNGPALLKDRLKVAQDQLAQLNERVKILKDGLSSTEDPEVIERLTRQSDIAEAKIGALRDEIKQLQGDLAMQTTEWGKLSTSMQESGKHLQDVGKKMSDVGGTLTKSVTLPMAAVGTAAVKAAIDVDSGLTSVRKTVDGTEEQYQQLKDAAIEFSKTNAVSAEQMLELDALGAQLGYSISELSMFGEVASGLNIATDMDAETAATELAQFANITKMAHSDTERYGSAIVNLGNNLATTESKVSSMAQRVAAAGTQVGMTQADILGLSGAMSSLGVEAEAGGTAMSTLLANINSAVLEGGARLDAFADAAGVSSEEFAQAWEKSPVEALQMLMEGLDKTQKSGGNLDTTLEGLGVTGIRQTDVVKRLAGNTELLSQAVELANDGWSENSALSKEVANRNESLASKFEILKNRVTAVLEKIGKPLADALIDALDAAEPLFKAIADGAQAFADMDEGQQRAIITALALVAALGPILSILGKVTSAVGIAREGIGKLIEHFVRAKATGGEMADATGKVGESLSGLSGPAGEAVTIIGKFVGIVAASVGVATFAQDVWQTASGMKELWTEGDKAIDSLNSFAQAMGEVQGHTLDASVLISSTGQSVTDLRSTIESEMATITETIKTSLAETGTVTEDASKKIEEQFLAAMDAATQRAETYAQSISAYSGALTEATSPDQLAENLKTVQNYYDEATAAIDADYQTQLNAVIAYHQSKGDVDSTEYEADIERVNTWRTKMLENVQGAYGDAKAEVTSGWTGLSEEQAKGWADIAEQMNAWDGEWAGWWASNSSIANSFAYSTWSEVKQKMADGSVAAMLAAAIGTKDGGRELTAETEQQVENVLSCFDDLPDSMKDEGTEAMRSLARSIEAMGVDLGDVSAMDGQQIVDRIRERLDQMPDVAESAGESAGNSLSSGLSHGTSSVEGAANDLAQAQRAADVSGEAEGWGYDLASNLASGLSWGGNVVSGAVNSIAWMIDSVLGHSVPKEGPLREGGRGEVVWGEDLIANFAQGMHNNAYLLEDEAQRAARILEQSFAPDLSARYDASLGVAGDYGRRAGVAGDINVSIQLSGVSLGSAMDVRSVSQEMASLTAREITSKLG